MTKSNLKDASSSAQRQRLLKYLQEKGSATTLEARRNLDIMHPAARISELRHIEGYNIDLHWVVEQTSQGIDHRIGKYILRGNQTNGDGMNICDEIEKLIDEASLLATNTKNNLSLPLKFRDEAAEHLYFY